MTMRRCLALLLAIGLVLGGPGGSVGVAFAQSGGNCSVFRTWNTGDSLTAGDLNSSFSTVGVTNMTQACLDGISDSLAGMQTKTDPFAGGTESLATSGAGEIQRLRWILHVLTGWQDWYREDQNLNFATGSGVQGSGIGRHVTAVGLHLWNTTSPAFPVLTSIADHQTGWYFPLAGHMAFAARDGNVNGGSKGGIEVSRWHAGGLILHHTAAIRFAHSMAQMNNGQLGHVTALRISTRPPSTNEAAGLNNQFGFTEGNDQIIVGHSGSALRLNGASITEGSNALVGMGSGNFLESKTISGSGITITHQAGQIILSPAHVGSVRMLSSHVTSSATGANTAETDLFSFVLPASTLASNGQSIRVTTWGTTAANANTKRMRIYFGSTPIIDTGAVALNNANWQLTAVVTRTGAATQEATGFLASSDTGVLVSTSGRAAPVETLSGTVKVAITGLNGAASASDIVARGWIVEILP